MHVISAAEIIISVTDVVTRKIKHWNRPTFKTKFKIILFHTLLRHYAVVKCETRLFWNHFSHFLSTWYPTSGVCRLYIPYPEHSSTSAWNNFQIISEACCSSRIFFNMLNVAEIIWKLFYFKCNCVLSMMLVGIICFMALYRLMYSSGEHALFDSSHNRRIFLKWYSVSAIDSVTCGVFPIFLRSSAFIGSFTMHITYMTTLHCKRNSRPNTGL